MRKWGKRLKEDDGSGEGRRQGQEWSDPSIRFCSTIKEHRNREMTMEFCPQRWMMRNQVRGAEA